MDVASLTYSYYYKEDLSDTGKRGSRLPSSARFAAVIFLSLMTAVLSGARAKEADTAAVPARAAARIDFKVNLTEFDRNYHGNDTCLEKALARLDSMVLDPLSRVGRVTVVGTASPEGPYAGNVRLAAGRAAALVAILRARYAFPDSLYAVATIPEDWEGMRLMLASDGSIPMGAEVLRFLDATEGLDPATRERRLKRLGGGRPYASMRDNVLPYLRRASVVVDYATRRVGRRVEAPLPAYPALRLDLPAGSIPRLALRTPAAATPRSRFFALKTNLLWDAALCANLGFEVELWPRWSLDVPVWYSPYDITSRWRLRLLASQPELRWWPREAGAGHYVGLHASIIGFNVSTGGPFRYQDPNHAAFGLGLGYGYAFHLDKARRWSMEAQIGAGYVSYKWVKYHNTGRDGAEVSRSGGTYWGVTRAGITLSYKFYRERKERRWMRW